MSNERIGPPPRPPFKQALAKDEAEKMPDIYLKMIREQGDRIAALEAQLAEARRPEMVLELPAQKGFYWRRIGVNTQPCVVFVSRERGIWVYEVPGCRGTIGIWPNDAVFWSAKPIPYDPMPKEAQ